MLWNVPDVSIEPNLSLANWQVYETDTGDCHLVGFCVERFEGRVSSAITAFDPASRCVVTRSGRSYRLHGTPGFNDDADYVWQNWKRINSVATNALTRTKVQADELGSGPEDINPYVRNNRWQLDSALAYGVDKLRFIALWNGEGGSAPGGTENMVETVRKHTGRVSILDTRRLFDL